jgi:predicted AlkP superfamily pyrophosphatase or phosphodiesterase
MEMLIYPDYTHSNLNFVAAILQHFGLQTKVPVLPDLPTDCFQKKHLIFLILDGFGANLLSEFHLPFLRDHKIDILTSVFPSTTTSAIPSLLSGQFPLEHGALGWSLYFKELVRLIAYLPAHDHITKKNLNVQDNPIYKLLDFESIFAGLQKLNPNLDLHYLVPKYISKSHFTQKMGTGAPIHGATSFYVMLKQIYKILKNACNPTFLYCYFTQPDSIEHEFGVYSQETNKFMKKTDFELTKFWQKIKQMDAEMFITADHGLIDVEEYICVNDFPELVDSMLYPLFPEGRFVSFFIKPHKREIFLNIMKQFESDFLLLSREEFFTKKLLGNGIPHKKIDDFIGDFIAIAIGRKAFKASYPNQKTDVKLKAHHCGLTGSEMLVPLIRLAK